MRLGPLVPVPLAEPAERISRNGLHRVHSWSAVIAFSVTERVNEFETGSVRV